MDDFWVFGLRGAGLALALLLGGLIVYKARHWDDPALIWLLAGLSVGPALVLSWNIAYRVWLIQFLGPTDRLGGGLFAGMQFRYILDAMNGALDLGCALAVAIGIAKLYSHARQRVRRVRPEEAANDPRS
jgi:hypothetical protein